jgi:hypothetical protein
MSGVEKQSSLETHYSREIVNIFSSSIGGK